MEEVDRIHITSAQVLPRLVPLPVSRQNGISSVRQVELSYGGKERKEGKEMNHLDGLQKECVCLYEA